MEGLLEERGMSILMSSTSESINSIALPRHHKYFKKKKKKRNMQFNSLRFAREFHQNCRMKWMALYAAAAFVPFLYKSGVDGEAEELLFAVLAVVVQLDKEVAAHQAVRQRPHDGPFRPVVEPIWRSDTENEKIRYRVRRR